MPVDRWKQLEQTPELLDAIAEASGSELAIQTRLRDRFDAELVRLAITLNELRTKAADKFSRAGQMWFDSVRLEQATSEAVAVHKAKRFAGSVRDLCCGLGADAIALANKCDVEAVDLDDQCGFFVSRNANAYDVADRVRFVQADAEKTALDSLVHIDPDRRASGARVRRLEQYQPGLEFLQHLASNGRGGAIKVSAASNFGGKFPGCEIELVSLASECKEATIWFGELAGDKPWRATSLPSGETIAGDPLDAVADIVEPMTYLFDPDPAVVRSGLVDVLCEQWDLSRLDDAEEYLTGEAIPSTSFVTAFRVLDETANNDKQIRRMLKANEIGPLEVKTRHVKADANALQKKFASKQGQDGVLLIAKVLGKTRAILCKRLR